MPALETLGRAIEVKGLSAFHYKAWFQGVYNSAIWTCIWLKLIMLLTVVFLVLDKLFQVVFLIVGGAVGKDCRYK